MNIIDGETEIDWKTSYGYDYQVDALGYTLFFKPNRLTYKNSKELMDNFLDFYISIKEKGLLPQKDDRIMFFAPKTILDEILSGIWAKFLEQNTTSFYENIYSDVLDFSKKLFEITFDTKSDQNRFFVFFIFKRIMNHIWESHSYWSCFGGGPCDTPNYYDPGPEGYLKWEN